MSFGGTGFGSDIGGSKKSLGKFLSIGVAGFVLLIGATFASNININTQGRVEFGQGLSRTSACDNEFTVTPFATFSNGSPGEFKFSGVRFSELNSSTNDPATGIGCSNVKFTVKLWADTGTALASYELNDYGSSFASPDGTVTVSNAGQTNSVATLTLTSSTISSQSVKKITIESAPAGPRTYVLGDTGPGGGTVYYVNNSGFTCGPTLTDTCKYLEYAPANWASVFSEWTTPTASGGWSDSYHLTNGAVDPPIVMSTSCTNSLGGSTAIGAGLKNTIAIAVCSSTNAAEHVRAYRGGGQSDWAIPTRNELTALNDYRKTLYPNWATVDDPVNGGISTIDAFWTSSGSGSGFYFEYLNRDVRGPLGPGQWHGILIKAVRAF